MLMLVGSGVKQTVHREIVDVNILRSSRTLLKPYHLRIAKSINCLMSPIRFLLEIPGIMLERKLRISGEPIIFKDWAGYLYWQYPNDKVRFNWRRKSVSDANHIIRYILKNVRAGWTCIDIGAHVGSVSIPLWSKVGPAGQVISVEADPSNADRIRANLKLNNFPEDYVINVAIADKTGILPLHCYPESNGWQTLGTPTFAKDYESFVIDVPAISFEEFAEICKIQSADFVKIDVEGAEILVLNGMRPFLKEKRIKCVVFEVNQLMLEGMDSDVSQLFSFWKEFDYEIWRLGDDGTPVAIEESWPSSLTADCIAFPCA